jgi:carbamoyltransferase
VAEAVADEKVVGMFQGRMEFGPRALGNRSILADARSAKMQSFLNLATKFRESFRPFAPICLEEDAGEYFEVATSSPYMLLVDQVRPERCLTSTIDKSKADLREWVNEPRSDVPAITHVDYSARVQTVDRDRSPDVHEILTEFKKLTGYGIMVNTSFNVRSEPIVCTPEDAYVCFMRTGIDVLVLDRFVLQKSEQPEWVETENWRDSFGLD